MRPNKTTAAVILFFFALQLSGCTTIKLVRPGKKPERLKSKKITVTTIDQRAYQFSEIRVYGDTLYGVNGVPFPEDRHNPDVISVPFSDVQSIYYRGHNTTLTVSLIFAGLTVLAVAAALFATAWNNSWGY